MHIHAHLIIAPVFASELLPESVRTPSVDVSHRVAEQFSVSDARTLITDALGRPVEAPERSFVLWCDTMTREAQNALLKLFEDPPEQSVFYLMIPHESRLIPTLRSRLIRYMPDAVVVASDDAALFLKRTYADRLAVIAALQKAKDSAGMVALGDALTTHVAAEPEQYGVEVVREAALTLTYLRTKGGSKKMLLEHLALTLPA
ncbi:MAG: hypothetical protein WDZ93_00990 [Candidatus Paceibacterota bacterium]